MKRGFTLSELIIMMIIIGILFSLGLGQRQKMIQERKTRIEFEENELDKYNIVDVSIFCRENNVSFEEFVKSDILKDRYDRWLKKEKE